MDDQKETPEVESGAISREQLMDRINKHKNTLENIRTENDADPLLRFSLKGKTEKMEKELQDEIFVLDGIALLGQSTTIYAEPNTGKTLIILKLLTESIEKGVIDPNKVKYINADDDYRALLIKNKIFRPFGFHMLAPDYEDFKAEDLLFSMTWMIEKDTASGQIIVIDVLKAFSDHMNKQAQTTGFNKIMKRFVAKGGTLIILTHVNKSRREGNLVEAGTTDLKDDCNAAYVIDTVSDDQNFTTVEFQQRKKRGSNLKSVVFRYASEAADYQELFESVERVDVNDAQTIRIETQKKRELKDNAKIIEIILGHIRDGITKKTQLVEVVRKSTDESKSKIHRILKSHDGGSYKSGHRWKCDKGEKHSFVYSETVENSHAKAKHGELSGY
jgi:hypothetical protein